MNKLMIISGLVFLLIAGCKKEDTVFNTDLALDSRFIIFNAPADTTKIVVYSDHAWVMELKETAPWLKIQKGSGNGTEYAIVSVTENLSDFPRAATLLFKAGDKSDTLKLGQRGLLAPSLAIKPTSVSATAAGGIIQAAITTTLSLDLLSPEISYIGGSDWISGLELVEGNLNFNTAANPGAEARSAMVYLSYQDILGTNLKDSVQVNQLGL
ncbi:hypothetical protein GCM10027051_15020 [Niabella terrae]